MTNAEQFAEWVYRATGKTLDPAKCEVLNEASPEWMQTCRDIISRASVEHWDVENFLERLKANTDGRH